MRRWGQRPSPGRPPLRRVPKGAALWTPAGALPRTPLLCGAHQRALPSGLPAGPALHPPGLPPQTPSCYRSFSPLRRGLLPCNPRPSPLPFLYIFPNVISSRNHIHPATLLRSILPGGKNFKNCTILHGARGTLFGKNAEIGIKRHRTQI